MTDKIKTSTEQLSDLAEAVQLLKLCVENCVTEIETLDAETKERLSDYRQKKHTAENALGQAATVKQQALQIARKLSDYNEQLKKLRRRAVTLSRDIRYEKLSPVHSDIDKINGMLKQWADMGTNKDCDCKSGSGSPECDCKNKCENG